MTVGRIRDSMQFHEAYILPKYDLEICIYSTNRSGAYGWQFAAIAWYKGEGYAGEKTGGCGYDKISTAISYALCNIKNPPNPEFKNSWGGTGQNEECILDFLGITLPDNDWKASNAFRKENIIHAHG